MTDIVKFDLSVITLAAAADGNVMQAFEDLHCAMLEWHGMELFPTVETVQAALMAGYAKCRRVEVSEATLKNYAFGILKWAKAGRVPEKLSMRAFQANPEGGKVKAKAKAKGAQTEPESTEAPKTPEGLTPLAQARAWINEIQAKRLAFLGTADAEALSEALLQALAILNRVKG